MTRLLTTREVMDLLRVSKPTLFRLLSAGKIRRVKVGGLTRVREADLEEYVRRQTGR